VPKPTVDFRVHAGGRSGAGYSKSQVFSGSDDGVHARTHEIFHSVVVETSMFLTFKFKLRFSDCRGYAVGSGVY
jgi:hypothetical protein